MRLVILAFLLAISSTSHAGEDDDYNLTAAVLKHGLEELIVTGGLRYCGNPGLAMTIFQLASNSMIDNLRASHTTSEIRRVGKRIIQAADNYVDGVKDGLILSGMDASEKTLLCKGLFEKADKLLQQ